MSPWNVKDLAKYLGTSPCAIRHMVLRGQVPYRKPAGRIYFLPDEIQEWMKRSPGKTIDEVLKEDQ